MRRFVGAGFEKNLTWLNEEPVGKEVMIFVWTCARQASSRPEWVSFTRSTLLRDSQVYVPPTAPSCRSTKKRRFGFFKPIQRTTSDLSSLGGWGTCPIWLPRNCWFAPQTQSKPKPTKRRRFGVPNQSKAPNKYLPESCSWSTLGLHDVKWQVAQVEWHGPPRRTRKWLGSEVACRCPAIRFLSFLVFELFNVFVCFRYFYGLLGFFRVFLFNVFFFFKGLEGCPYLTHLNFW